MCCGRSKYGYPLEVDSANKEICIGVDKRHRYTSPERALTLRVSGGGGGPITLGSEYLLSHPACMSYPAELLFPNTILVQSRLL